jgi:ATP-dependent DNA helicase RecQ
MLPACELSPADDAIFQRLRQWRTRLAREQGLPAYIILLDKTLREIATTRPSTLSELTGISGIGEAKVQRYGSDILAALKEA